MIIYYKFIFFILSIEYVISKKNLQNIKWKCANENCSGIIAKGYANRDYKIPGDEAKLKFMNGDEFQLYKKSDEGYFYVESKGIKGIVEKSYFSENKVYVKDSELVDELIVENLGSPKEQLGNSETTWKVQKTLPGEIAKDESLAVPNSTSAQTEHIESKKVTKPPYDPYKLLGNINNANNTDLPPKTIVEKISVESTISTVNGPKVENPSLLDTNLNHTNSDKTLNSTASNNSEEIADQKDKQNSNVKEPSSAQGSNDTQSNKQDPNDITPISAQGSNNTHNNNQSSNDKALHDDQVGNDTQSNEQNLNVTNSDKTLNSTSSNTSEEIASQNDKKNSNVKEPSSAQGSNDTQSNNQDPNDITPISAQGSTVTQNNEQNSNGTNGNKKDKQRPNKDTPVGASNHKGLSYNKKLPELFLETKHDQSTSINPDKSAFLQHSEVDVSITLPGTNLNESQISNVFNASSVQESPNSTVNTSTAQDNIEKSTKKFEETQAISTEGDTQNIDLHKTQNEEKPSKLNDGSTINKSFYYGSSTQKINKNDINQKSENIEVKSKISEVNYSSSNLEEGQNTNNYAQIPENVPKQNSDPTSQTSQIENISHKHVDTSKYSDAEDINETKKSEEKTVETSEIVPNTNSDPILKISQIEISSHKHVDTSKYSDAEDINETKKSEEKNVETSEIVPNLNSDPISKISQIENISHKHVDTSKYSDAEKINDETNKSEEKIVETPEIVPKSNSDPFSKISQTENSSHEFDSSYSDAQDTNDKTNLKENHSKNEQITENSEIANESVTIDEKNDSSMFSGVYSIMQSLQDMLSKSPLPKQETPEPIIENIEEKIALYAEYTEETCADSSWMSLKTICLLGFTSIVILIFSLGYYYMDNSKRDFELVTKNNELASELFILQKERTVLEERLQTAEENANQNSGEASKYTYEVESLKTELNELKNEKTQMEEKEQVLIKKCSMLETNYVKLRQMVSESKQKGERSILIADIKKLKESSTTEILSLKEQLDIKTEESKTLMVKLAKANELKDRLEQKLNTMMSEEQIAVKHYQDSVSKLEQMIEESKATVIKLEDEVGKLKKENESLIIEKELAETSLQKAHGLKSSESLSAWLQSKEIQIALVKNQKNLEDLQLKYNELLNEKSSLSDKEKSLQTEFEELNEKYEQAEKSKIEALTKLQVLSDYFNEKETQLQEELGTKEALWLQKQSDDHTIYEQMRTLREENQTFKNQNETLKKEIIDQETSYKKLISSAEEKADGYWVSLRQAERRLKETQIEAAQLRNRLTAIETSDISDDKKVEVNGDMPYGPPTSPPFMLYPSEFIPPPPLIPTTPSRPPPLGRISSPTLGDFTPPLPLPPFDLYPPSPPPPPPSHYVHKPQPRETRKQKDSQSSNHSSESTDKMHRRTKR